MIWNKSINRRTNGIKFSKFCILTSKQLTKFYLFRIYAICLCVMQFEIAKYIFIWLIFHRCFQALFWYLCLFASFISLHKGRMHSIIWYIHDKQSIHSWWLSNFYVSWFDWKCLTCIVRQNIIYFVCLYLSWVAIVIEYENDNIFRKSPKNDSCSIIFGEWKALHFQSIVCNAIHIILQIERCNVAALNIEKWGLLNSIYIFFNLRILEDAQNLKISFLSRWVDVCVSDIFSDK